MAINSALDLSRTAECVLEKRKNFPSGRNRLEPPGLSRVISHACNGPEWKLKMEPTWNHPYPSMPYRFPQAGLILEANACHQHVVASFYSLTC